MGKQRVFTFVLYGIILFNTATLLKNIYFKHASSPLTCNKLNKNLGDPVAECTSELVSSHCRSRRLLSEVDTSQGLVLGKQREEKVYLSIGIVSTEGNEENLMQVLHSLTTHTSSAEYSELVIIIVASEGGANAAILQRILKDFQNELDSGQMLVVYPTTTFLREASAAPLGWRTLPFTEGFKKKTADFNKRLIFLFEYCFTISKNFLLLTEEARPVRPFFPVINQVIRSFENLNLSSYVHDFGAHSLPGLGRLYSRKLAGDLAEFGTMFPEGHPPHQIIDTHSVLRATVKVTCQRSEDILFSMGKKLRGIKPEVDFKTTGDIEVGHGFEKAFYEKEGFTWLRTPNKDDSLVMVFKELIQISRVRVATGSPLYRDTLSDSKLMACGQNAETGCSESQCTEIGEFRDPILDATNLESAITFPVKCLRIVFTGDGKHWIIIREISIWPTEKYLKE